MQNLFKNLLITVLASSPAMLSAAPVAYSINSDSISGNADSLYRIDLATGAETRIAPVKSLGELRIDVEGLAFAPDGTLYGLDDSSMTLFPLNPDNAVVQTANEVPIDGLPTGGGNDFGMTFTCDGTLFVTSVTKRFLYQMSLEGKATPVGNAGLGANISALAAFGTNPVRLYGLGNGLDDQGKVDAPNLYSIDTTTGKATVIGPLGAAALAYAQGGLAFDDSGQLWAITDRRNNLGDAVPSQVFRIDTNTGAASAARNTTEAGFESLAITVPRGCTGVPEGPHTQFRVQKQFVDRNNVTPVTLRISCNDGLPLDNVKTVQPNEGTFGEIEVSFFVTEFTDGNLNCDVWEETPDAYSATYQCFSEGSCSTAETRCSFSSVNYSQDNLCLIRNYPKPVELSVRKVWELHEAALPIEEKANVSLYCSNAFDGDGVKQNNGVMHWSWEFIGADSSNTALVAPAFDGSTHCWAVEDSGLPSAVESESDCPEPGVPVLPGEQKRECVVTNTVFFEGIPTLNNWGLLMATALMLLSGMLAARRF